MSSSAALCDHARVGSRGALTAEVALRDHPDRCSAAGDGMAPSGRRPGRRAHGQRSPSPRPGERGDVDHRDQAEPALTSARRRCRRIPGLILPASTVKSRPAKSALAVAAGSGIVVHPRVQRRCSYMTVLAHPRVTPLGRCLRRTGRRGSVQRRCGSFERAWRCLIRSGSSSTSCHWRPMPRADRARDGGPEDLKVAGTRGPPSHASRPGCCASPSR